MISRTHTTIRVHLQLSEAPQMRSFIPHVTTAGHAMGLRINISASSEQYCKKRTMLGSPLLENPHQSETIWLKYAVPILQRVATPNIHALFAFLRQPGKSSTPLLNSHGQIWQMVICKYLLPANPCVVIKFASSYLKRPGRHGYGPVQAFPTSPTQQTLPTQL